MHINRTSLFAGVYGLASRLNALGMLPEAPRMRAKASRPARPARPHHQLQPQARERARRVGGAAWDLFKDADRARRGLPMGG